jgi:hypothetical protein
MYVCIHVSNLFGAIFLYLNFKKLYFIFLISSYQLKEFIHLQITVTMLVPSYWTSQLNHDINFLFFFW